MEIPILQLSDTLPSFSQTWQFAWKYLRSSIWWFSFSFSVVSIWRLRALVGPVLLFTIEMCINPHKQAHGVHFDYFGSLERMFFFYNLRKCLPQCIFSNSLSVLFVIKLSHYLTVLWSALVTCCHFGARLIATPKSKIIQTSQTFNNRNTCWESPYLFVKIIDNHIAHLWAFSLNISWARQWYYLAVKRINNNK